MEQNKNFNSSLNMAMYGYYSPEMQAEIEKKDKLNQFKNRINSFKAN